MSNVDRRRALVVLGFTLSILAATVTIRLAAGWTASAATLVERPPDVAELTAELQQEQARAAALTDQLTGVTAQAEELQAALAAAQDKAGADAKSAARLAAQLDEAKKRLETLQAQLASRPPVTTTVVAAAPSTAVVAADRDDDEHEEDEDGYGDEEDDD